MFAEKKRNWKKIIFPLVEGSIKEFNTFLESNNLLVMKEYDILKPLCLLMLSRRQIYSYSWASNAWSSYHYRERWLSSKGTLKEVKVPQDITEVKENKRHLKKIIQNLFFFGR